MMLIDSTFELGIPTHISFTLFKYDYFDSVIISRVRKECKNYSENEGEYTVKASSFISALNTSKRLRSEIKKVESLGFHPNPEHKPNSIFFLWSIIKRLNNLEWMTFKISEDRKYTRIVKVERGEVVSFHFKIVEGIFDLTKILDRKELDDFNKTLIDVGILKNKYLERSPYFYMKATVLFDILSTMEVNGLLSSFNFLAEIDNKLEEDDPVLPVKTDYTPY